MRKSKLRKQARRKAHKLNVEILKKKKELRKKLKDVTNN